MNRKTWIILGIGTVGVIAIGYWQRQRIKRLAKKGFSVFSDIFANPEKLSSPDAEGSISKMKPELAKRLKKVKKLWNRLGYKGKLEANSGYRTDEHNKKVGGVEDSEHRTGEGVDIRMPDRKTSMKFALAASKAGFKRIGVGNTFVHLGISKTLPQLAWTYKGTNINKEDLRAELAKVYRA